MGSMGKHVTYWCHECHKFFGQGQGPPGSGRAGGMKQETCAKCRPVQQGLVGMLES